MVIGLTGKYCAGKDTVARVLASLGCAVIDVDALGHEALQENAARVIETFGPAVASAGGIDRRAVGRAVFGRPDELARLERIVHPAMVRRVKERIAAAGGDVVVNAAILHRMGLHVLCDAVIFVTAPAAVRLLRAVRRDHLGPRDALARIRSQADIRPQLRGAGVDTYIVRNLGQPRSLERRVAQLARRLRG